MNLRPVAGAALLFVFAVLLQSLPKPPVESKYLSLDQILASSGTELPVVWGDLGKSLLEAGVLDQQKLQTLYGNESAYREFVEPKDGKVLLTRQNAPIFLNFLWALGLGNKNEILESGEMALSGISLGDFASTGGFNLSTTNALDHYSQHEFIKLNLSQQRQLERISRSIYRPCCNNSTHFPDCNHGMAMLGLLELGISQGLSENELYNLALAANIYWFENNYRSIEQYLDSQESGWAQTPPEAILSAKHSSGSGYQKVQQALNAQNSPGPSCGVK
ncbi:MAG: hypothetical protein HY395_02435 [Candidatus Doudnabacteria bacterium]|nr:hypothetical protein [Candidatus Doudnabacteria bacterium]